MINISNEQGVKPFTVTYHTANGSRIAPNRTLLEDRWLHKIFLITHIPATWTGWQLAISLLVVALVVGLIWWPLGVGTLLAVGIYLLFALADWLLLWWLPRSSRSFGPVGPQLLVKTVPRLGIVIISAAIAWLSGSYVVGLWVLVLLQLCGTLIYWWGSLYEPFAISTTHQSVQSSALTPNSLPIRLLHLSDLHVERLTHRESQRLLELVEQAAPDIIVITGDYLNLSYVNDSIARADVRKVLVV